MRQQVRELVALGPLPADDVAEEDELEQYHQLLESVYRAKPVTDEEARALVKLFPPDGDTCFGLAWTLVHLVETAPGWPLADCLAGDGEWLRRLHNRAENARR